MEQYKGPCEKVGGWIDSAGIYAALGLGLVFELGKLAVEKAEEKLDKMCKEDVKRKNERV